MDMGDAKRFREHSAEVHPLSEFVLVSGCLLSWQAMLGVARQAKIGECGKA